MVQRVVAAERKLVLDGLDCNLVVWLCYIDGIAKPGGSPVAGATSLRMGWTFGTLTGQFRPDLPSQASQVVARDRRTDAFAGQSYEQIFGIFVEECAERTNAHTSGLVAMLGRLP